MNNLDNSAVDVDVDVGTTNTTKKALTPLQVAALQELRKNLQQELKERRIDPVMLPIVNQYLAGKSVEDIAADNELEPFEVALILDKPEIRRYCDHVIQSAGYMNKLRRVALINDVIDQKVQEAMEYNSPLSNKDLLDWIKILQEETKIIENKGPKTAVQVNQSGKTNIVQLMEDLLADDD